MSLSDDVAQLEGELEQALAKVDELQGTVDELRNELAFQSSWDDGTFDLIEDHRRGLLSTEELYEQTVGR